MKRSMIDRLTIAGLAFLFIFSGGALAQRADPRLALVIGNAAYRSGALATAANDAGLVAETLQADGFEVVGAANLDQDSLRRAFRDFLAKAEQAGPGAIVFVYLSGRGLQYEGENYLAPIEAVIARDTDIPIQAVRVSDFTRALAALPLRARIVALDAARANGFAKNGQPLAGGLALVDAEPGTLYGFNAAPGTIAPDEPGPYGAYATALAEMLRDGGVPIDEAFSRVRLRVDQVTHGAFLPWDVSKIEPPIVLLAGAPKAPPVAAQSYTALQARPIRDFPAEEAYAAAIERDTIGGYRDFLEAYPDSPLARRVRALLAARREALTWRRAVSANSPDAYWSYMRRYPRGPHFWDARRRLEILAAALEPPPRFEIYDFGGLPPPPQIEYEIIDRPVILFDPQNYPPPPPPPAYFLAPQPAVFIALAPPPPQGPGFLPIPIPIAPPGAHPNAPRGILIQQNFGQQGPIGAGQHPGEQAAPGATPPAPELTPAPLGHPNAPGAQAPSPGAAQPSHALPQGNRLPPAAQPGAHQSQTPAGTAAPQAVEPGVAPSPSPAPSPVRPGGHVVPPPAGAPARSVEPKAAPKAVPKVEPKSAPNHAPPQGGEPPHAAAPQAKPKPPEPAAVHANAPASPPQPEAKAPHPQQSKVAPPREAKAPAQHKPSPEKPHGAAHEDEKDHKEQQ